MERDEVKVLLFDLGGVLVDWAGADGLAALSRGGLTREAARRFWLESPWIRRFEKGACSPEEFARGVVEELGLECPFEDFLSAFGSWDRGPLPGALDLLDELAPRFLLTCLSNNNELHWKRLRAELDLDRRFRRAYASHETGLFKPDREAYEHVLADLGVPGPRVLFFDDNPECVQAAREVGLRAEEVHGVEEVRRALAELGLHP